MPKHHPANVGAMDDAVRIAGLLRPMVESAVSSLTPAARSKLRRSVIDCERMLADASVAPTERLSRVHRELENDTSFGATWRVVLAMVDEYANGNAPVGAHELASVSLILGQILAASDSREAA